MHTVQTFNSSRYSHDSAKGLVESDKRLKVELTKNAPIERTFLVRDYCKSIFDTLSIKKMVISVYDKNEQEREKTLMI